MLPIRLGSFLTNEEVKKTKYEYNKPLIKLCCMAIFTLTAASSAVMGAAVLYAKYNTPTPIVAEREYAAAQKQVTNITKSLAVIRDARPNNLDALDVVSKISSAAASSKITIIDIDITANKYVIKGVTQNIKDANEFSSALDFDKSYTKSLSNISNNSGEMNMDFTVTITPTKEQKGGKK